MANIIEINDLSLPALDAYARLTDAQMRSLQDKARARFIAEGAAVIAHALDCGIAPVSMLLPRKHVSGKAKALIDRVGDIPVYTADDEILQSLTGYELTKGILCEMKRPEPKSDADIAKNARRLALLEGIVDPTNIGAIMRCAAGLGMDGVLLAPDCCDPLRRRAVRVSMGTVFQTQWAFTVKTELAIEKLRCLGFRSAAMALTDDCVDISNTKLRECERLVVVLGTEGSGLRDTTIAACDYRVKIPMANGVDSLNVAAAAAVMFWELGKKNV